MTEADEKKKPTIEAREPKKKVAGIFDNLRKLPQAHPVEEILGLAEDRGSTPSILPRPSTDSTASRPSTLSRQQNKTAAVSPERDYTKVANSIVRLAVPSGIFGEQGGKAKELYDTLYHLTRGAVVPQRKVRIPKDRLMKKAGIGSEVTLRKNLARLRVAKLINERLVPGMHGGNEYEVFLPEEVGLSLSTPSTPRTASNAPQNREGVETLDSTGSSVGSNLAASITSADDKTFLLRPEKNIDDEPAALLLRLLQEAEREVAGKTGDPQRWSEPLGIIIAELKVAASRSAVISSAPAFLAEHLRRRLGKAERQAAASPAEASSAPGQAPAPRKREFTEEPCSVCKGSLMEVLPNGEKKRCGHCRDEVNYPRGREPKNN
jgi:hypothetical protein